VSTPFPEPVRGVVICLSLLVAVLMAGCDRSAAEKKPQAGQTQGKSEKHADHANHAGDEHPRPVNFAAGVRELKEHYLEIKKAFEQADMEKAIEQAHEPLHAVGDILEALPDLAKQSNLPPEELQTVKKSVDALFEGYGSVDDALHEGKEPNYQAVAANIDQAMAAMEAVHTPPEK
jgi:hypothetical protein